MPRLRGKTGVRVRDYVMLKILDMLYREPMHGYKVMKQLESSFGVRFGPSILYPVLRKLREMGFVVASEVSVGARRVIVYEITQDGREFLERNRSSLEAFEKRLARVKECGLIELMKRLREVLMNIDKLSSEDVEKLKKAISRFLEETQSLGVLA
jgi:DNA-binding PadR family transcriptional regulator